MTDPTSVASADVCSITTTQGPPQIPTKRSSKGLVSVLSALDLKTEDMQEEWEFTE